MPLPQRVSQPTRDALAATVPASYGDGISAVVLSNASADAQRMPQSRVRAMLRKVTDLYAPAAVVLDAAVKRGVATIADGGTDAVAGTVHGTPTALTYDITNTGSELLVLGGLTLGTPVNCTVAVATVWALSQPAILQDGSSSTVSESAPSVDNVPVAGAGSIVVTVTPTAAGAWSCTISIPTNATGKNPYNWTMSGTAT